MIYHTDRHNNCYISWNQKCTCCKKWSDLYFQDFFDTSEIMAQTVFSFIRRQSNLTCFLVTMLFLFVFFSEAFVNCVLLLCIQHPFFKFECFGVTVEYRSAWFIIQTLNFFVGVPQRSVFRFLYFFLCFAVYIQNMIDISFLFCIFIIP